MTDGDRLRNFRLQVRSELGFTEAEVARAFGVTARTWRDWEHGLRRIPKPVLWIIYAGPAFTYLADNAGGRDGSVPVDR